MWCLEWYPCEHETPFERAVFYVRVRLHAPELETTIAGDLNVGHVLHAVHVYSDE